MKARGNTDRSWARARHRIRWILSLVVLFVLTLLADHALASPAAAPDHAPTMAAEGLHVPHVPSDYATRNVGGWLTISYPRGTEERLAPVFDQAEEMKSRLAGDLGRDILPHVDVRIARTPEAMSVLAPLEAPPFAYASAMAYSSINLVLISLQAPGTFEGVSVQETLMHELAHIALSDALLGHPVPRWFNEGLAVSLSGESALDRASKLHEASYTHSLLSINELDTRFPNDDAFKVGIAYAQSADFVRFLLKGEDRARFHSLIDRVSKGAPFERALTDAYGADLRALDYQWRTSVEARSSYWPAVTAGSFLWLIGIVALGFAYVKKKRRAKVTLARWDEESAREAEMRREIEAMVARPDNTSLPPTHVLPHVEHEGQWHTLH